MSEPKPTFISKSKFMEGRHCPKLFWYEFKRKNAIPPYDPLTKAVMEEGKKVGKYAQLIYPNGILIERDWSAVRTHEKTLQALRQGQPIFEGGLVFGQAYAIADIFLPAGNGDWDLIEVKSSTSLKNDYYDDIAFQKFVYTGAGLPLRRCFLMVLDRDYIKKGAIEPGKLFRREDVTETVDERLPGVRETYQQLLEVLQLPEPPDIQLGTQCNNCALKEVCWHFLPEDDHVFVLHKGEKVAYDLMSKGILKLADLPPQYELNEKHKIQHEAIVNNRAYIDKAAINEFLAGLKYPLYFLDFETLAPAVPIYDLSHPYEEIPFQYSLHKQAVPDGVVEHAPFLAAGQADPRPEVLQLLREQLGSQGSILAYNANYELNCLKRAAAAFPQHQSWVDSLADRFVDLWQPFKNFAYYHPDQQESTSMKVVLPALTGAGYDKLEIGEGWTARQEYMRVTFEPEIDPADRQAVRSALEKYCALDTKGMVDIVEALKQEIRH
ncbi:hypothetical protein A2311_05665 [candidate division WOR-1 bacterium RIFOXYB2_FULL_48_7]|uniref:DUF2779 domain-containing protein n=1 Tax=candidate division WOR-1 bacterium RIFOXYB2_FULL_48_7 TaxID=1802583 RepID=A0A1F4TMR6_UNCSA|nr:MAG: hypothetical protein A2311_05665 [candidate division WOR-1 bacterium RIFOXYB2_FULL_48_7]